MRKIGLYLIVIGGIIFYISILMYKKLNTISCLCLFLIFIGSSMILLERCLHIKKEKSFSLSDARITLGAALGGVLSIIIFAFFFMNQ